MTPLLTTWGDRGPSLVAVIHYHATYLFLYILSYVAIMSFYDSAPITDFWRCLKGVDDLFPLGVVFWFSLFTPGAILDHVDRHHLSKLFARLC